jgi:Fur family zinc uptake transcriptional regulator
MGASKSVASAVTFGNKHDHAHCIEEALDQAEQVCEKSGERFTDLRRQVFKLVWAGHKPVKAYDLMSDLASKRSGVAPATVYRTLDFLQSQGLVHKLESLNAYLGCSHPEKEHQGHFLICEGCEEVRELNFASFSRSINRIAREQKFLIKHTTIELFGLCNNCQEAGDGPT